MLLLSHRILPLTLLTRVALTADLATIDPCPQNPGHDDLITVTSQYQPVSTCIPQVEDGTTSYSYSTYDYISTTLQYAPDGTSTTDVLVTDTDQWVTVTKYPEATNTIAMRRRAFLDYEITEKQGLCRYKDMGKLAIPGWEGSRLCKECDQVAADGSIRQKVHMQECRWRSTGQKCIEYDETWISFPPPEEPYFEYPVCSAWKPVYEAGSYTFTFPQPQAIVTVTAGGKVTTATRAPWTAYITKTCGGPTTFEFTTTVTKTITIKFPYGTDGPTVTYTNPNPPPTGFPPPPPPGGGPGPNPSGPPYPGDGPTLTGPPTGGPSITGPYTTLTAVPGGQNTGTLAITATIALPSGSVPGTVVVLEPTLTSNTGFPTSTFTGSFVTETVTPTGTGASSLSGTFTVTVADPTGTSPGTVVVVDPGNNGATSSTSSSTDDVSAILTSTSSTSGPITLGTITATATNDPDSTTFITFTTDSSTIVVPCVGVLCASVGASLPGGDVGASATLLPTQITLPTIIATETNDPGSTTLITETAGSSTFVVPCVGVLCATISASLPGVDVGATLTVIPTPITLPPILATGTNDPGSTTFITETAGSSTFVVPCIGVLCAEVSATLPVGNIGVSVTVLPTPITLPPILATGTNDPGSTTFITETAGSSTFVVPCIGVLCAEVSATLPVVGEIGASVTVLPTPITLPAILATGTNDPRSTTFITETAGSSTYVVPCVGLLCAQVSATLPVVGEAGVSVTVLPTRITLAPIIATGTDDPRSTTLITETAGSSTYVVPCVGLLCAQVSATLPVVGEAGVSVTVLPTRITLAPIIATGTNDPESTTLITEIAGSSTFVVPCIGVLCADVSATLPVVGEIGASVTVLPTPIGLPEIIATGANDAGSTTTFTEVSGSTTYEVPCVGVLCAALSVTLPIVGNAGASLTILPTPLITVAPIIATGSGDPMSTTFITQTAGGSTEVVPCVGLLCAQVAASLLGAVNAGATATVLPSQDITLPTILATAGAGDPRSTTTITETTGGTTLVVPCVGLLCASVSASLPALGGIGASIRILPAIARTTPATSPASTSAAESSAVPEATSCSGLLCVSAAASASEIIGATATAGVPSTALQSVAASVQASAPGVVGVSITAGTGGSSPSSPPVVVSVSIPSVSVATVPTVSVGGSVAVTLPTVSLGGSVAVTLPTVSVGGVAASASPLANTQPAAVSSSRCNGLLCASVGVSAGSVGVTATLGVVNSPAAQTPATTPRAASPTVSAAAPATPAATSAARSSQARVGISVSLPLAKRDDAAVPTTLVKSPVNKRLAAPAMLQKQVSEPCSLSINVCEGMDVDTLFTSKPCASQFRLGCKLSTTLNSALNTCLESGCLSYGITSDGSHSLTSSLSLSEVQERIHAYAEAYGGVCNIGQTVKLYSRSTTC